MAGMNGLHFECIRIAESSAFSSSKSSSKIVCLKAKSSMGEIWPLLFDESRFLLISSLNKEPSHLPSKTALKNHTSCLPYSDSPSPTPIPPTSKVPRSNETRPTCSEVRVRGLGTSTSNTSTGLESLPTVTP